MTGVPASSRSTFANTSCSKHRTPSPQSSSLISKERSGHRCKRRSRSPFLTCIHAPTGHIASLAVLYALALVQSGVASNNMIHASNAKTFQRMASMSFRGLALNRLSRSSLSIQQVYQKTTSCFVPTIPSHLPIKIPTGRCRTISASSTTSLSMTSSISTNWEQISNHKTSKTVKLFKSVHRANKSKRSELGLTVAEGVRLVSDILANEESRQLVRRIVISESLLYDNNDDQYQNQLQHWLNVVDEESRQRNADSSNDETYTIPTCSINVGTDQVVEACSATVTSQGVVALMEMPSPYDPSTSIVAENNDMDSNMPPFYLILDGLSDPGNVGTLLRTCAASHVTALILLPGSCDVWNPKAIRSAMGASFRVPVLEMSKASEKEALDHVLNLLKGCGVDNSRVFAATMEASGDNASLAHYGIDFASKGGAAVILGREGEGLRSDVRNAIKQGKISTVHVPMAPGMESLNAAVCGSVIMFERMRQLQLLTSNQEDGA